MDVHAKDVVEDMTKKEIRKTNDFNWLCQLRYYWIVRKIYYYILVNCFKILVINNI